MTTVQANHSIASVDPRKTAPYRYARLLPHFSPTTYPPLTPFEHTDPGLRALTHSSPRSFLNAATGTIELTPNLGTEVCGINLAQLDSDNRDQLAFEVPLIVFHNFIVSLTTCYHQVATRGLLVFRDQHEFIDRGPDFYLEWGRHFGRYMVHSSTSHLVLLMFSFKKASYSSHVGPPQRLS